jgi:hypothetical protein
MLLVDTDGRGDMRSGGGHESSRWLSSCKHGLAAALDVLHLGTVLQGPILRARKHASMSELRLDSSVTLPFRILPAFKTCSAGSSEGLLCVGNLEGALTHEHLRVSSACMVAFCVAYHHGSHWRICGCGGSQAFHSLLRRQGLLHHALCL